VYLALPRAPIRRRFGADSATFWRRFGGVSALDSAAFWRIRFGAVGASSAQFGARHVRWAPTWKFGGGRRQFGDQSARSAAVSGVWRGVGGGWR
jgi:hypothetical protein